MPRFPEFTPGEGDLPSDPCAPIPPGGYEYDPGYLCDRLAQAQDEIRKLREKVDSLDVQLEYVMDSVV